MFKTTDDIGNEVFEKKYIKTIKRKKNKQPVSIHFYIEKELFELDKINKIDTCSVKIMDNKIVSNIEDLSKVVNQGNSFYPYKNFEKVYLVEKFNEELVILYDVKWVYYIE